MPLISPRNRRIENRSFPMAIAIGKANIGTAYQSDAGMCGDYNSVIGMEKTEPMRRFITGMAKGRFSPAEGPATLSGLFVETDDRTGKAQAVKMIRHGGLLEASAP
ncbi:MAG: hypothetical protein EBZ27_13980 [Rhodobacteraceae bacterium]|nr:hypothetical protein [Paracoccaceae bacterium]